MLSPCEIEAVESYVGFTRIFHGPIEGRQYVLGADVAEGVSGGDYSCGQVLDYETMEQVAVWHGRLAPDLFARELYILGAFYNWSYLACEFNGCGQVTLNKLHKDFLYPNLYYRQNLSNLDEPISVNRPGFITSSRTKPIILNHLQQLIRDEEIHLHDKATIKELLSYAYDSTKAGHRAYGAPDGEHDDRVMALAVACEAHRQYVPPSKPDPDVEFNRTVQSLGIAVPARRGDLRHRDKPSFSNKDWCSS